MKLKYGSDYLNITMPADCDILEARGPSDEVSRESFIHDLDKYVGRKRFRSAGIVISDKTRLCSYDRLLPWLTDYLEESGNGYDNITFYIAYGTHPAQSDEESVAAYGETFRKFRFIHHNCDDKSSMVSLGRTSSGTDVMVRKEIPDHDMLILMGALSHHYFAGYGGGRKLIFPGLAAKESIYWNHKLFIDFKSKRLHPGCQSGKINGNPVGEDLKEIDSMLPPKVIISGILNPSGKVARLMTGSSYADFEEACNVYDSFYRSKSEKLYDLVIASSGGYPKDINLIQSHKSMHNAASFVKDGGTLILLAECRDGVGNDKFMALFNGSREDILDHLEKNYSGNGGTALSLLAKSSRIKILFHTTLSENDCNLMGVSKISKTEIDELLGSFKGSAAAIPNGSIIYR